MKLTESDPVLSRLVIRTYFILLDGNVPGPGLIPFTLIKSIDVVGGTVTILLSTLVMLPIVKRVSLRVLIPLTTCSSFIFTWKEVGSNVDAIFVFVINIGGNVSIYKLLKSRTIILNYHFLVRLDVPDGSKLTPLSNASS